MSSSFGEFSQAWTRGAMLLACILILNFRFRIFKKIQKKDWPWFIGIALAGGLNQAPYFIGFKYLSIGTATMLFYAALVVGGYVIGKLVFREKITGIKLISLALALIGIGAVYRFSLTPDQFIPAALTMIAGLLGATAAVMPKKLSGEYPEFQIMAGYFIVMIVVNGFLGIVLHDPLPSLAISIPWLAQLGYATAMLLANWAVIEGFKYLDASIGSLIGLAEILFGVTFGIMFFGETLGIGTIIGGVLIVASAALPNIKVIKREQS